MVFTCADECVLAYFQKLAILALRTYALHNRDRRVMYGIAVAGVICSAIALVSSLDIFNFLQIHVLILYEVVHFRPKNIVTGHRNEISTVCGMRPADLEVTVSQPNVLLPGASTLLTQST